MASTFCYIAVKGALSSSDCDAFGLDPEEISALAKRFPNSKAVVTNGVTIKGPPLTVINTLCQLGYKVVSSTGEIEITWTLQRETSASRVNRNLKMCDHNHAPISTNPSVHQTLDELEFERSLGYAALCGEFEKAVKHLQKGTNANSYDAGGYAPLHYAARNGHMEIAQLLLNHGADINIRTKAGKATPLLRAALSGKEEMCRFLVRKGADFKAVDNDGQTVLHRAVDSGNMSIVNYFLDIAPELRSQADNRGLAPVISSML